MKLDQVNHIPQRDGYGQGLLDLCAAREDVVVLDADVSASTRTGSMTGTLIIFIM